MTANKDYYDILGVGKNASLEEIKKAYRKLAREHHPDVAKDSDKKAAEKRFKEINEAYQVLSDPQKRKMYDQFGTADPQGQGFGGFSGRQGQWGPFSYTYSNNNPFSSINIDPFDIFEEFFGFRGFGGASRPRKGKNLYYEMDIDLKDAVFGLEKEINIESGKVKIKIPAGIRSGMEVKFPGKGMPSIQKGSPAGDLYINIRVKTPKNIDILRETVVVKKEIDFSQAVLGDTIEVPIIDLDNKNALGKAKLKIPSGTQHGTKFALRGKGMPRVRLRGRGDVIVQVFINIPKRLNRKQKDLLEKYKQTL